MVSVIAGLAVFGVIIATGWLLVRCGAVPAGSDTVLTRVCFYAATPALLITTVAHADLAAVLSADTLAGLSAEVIGVLSAWCVHRFLLHRSVEESTIGALAAGYVNAANLGIPVLILLLGSAAAIAPILLLQLLILAPVSFALLDWCAARRAEAAAADAVAPNTAVAPNALAPDQGAPEPANPGTEPANPGTEPANPGQEPARPPRWRTRLRTWSAPARNPLLIGVLVGLVLNRAHWNIEGWLGGLVGSSLHELGALAVTLMMLSLGMSLAGASPHVTRRLTIQQVSRLREPEGQRTRLGTAPADSGAFDDTPDRGPVLWVTVVWKLLIVPACALALGLLFGLRGSQLLTPITTAALPSAQNVFMYATRYGVAKPLARDCVLLTTLGCVPVLLLAAALVG